MVRRPAEQVLRGSKGPKVLMFDPLDPLTP